MGQYHYMVNLDKREYIDHYQLGDGAKLWEKSADGGSLSALLLLLACSNGRGGGDFNTPQAAEVAGRWAGDRIAVVGDYAEPEDLPEEFEAENIYELCDRLAPNGYKDITPPVAVALAAEYGIRYSGPLTWKDRVADDGTVQPKAMSIDMVIGARGIENDVHLNAARPRPVDGCEERQPGCQHACNRCDEGME